MPPAFSALEENTGHCGDWAWFLSDVLAYQGIDATAITLEGQPGFYPGPAPHAYMLIEPGLWSFTSKNESGAYPYADPLSVSKDGEVTVDKGSVIYTPSSTPISQGQVSTPPEMFSTGDHAIVDTPWGYVDPSYGNPQTNAPYSSIASYEKTAIAGFAAIYYKDDKGQWTPLQNGQTCETNACEFQAVPYAESGAP